jgi:ubiquinone/menaquinone biosynthesis C-methylase UbiE
MKNERRHVQLNEQKWDKWAKSFDEKGRIHDYLREAQNGLVSLLDINPYMSFLDVGCGTGWALGEIAKSLHGRGQFYGVDLSTKMIAKAKENFKNQANFHFMKANAELIPLNNEFFDLIICTNSFHHYLNPVKVLKEMKRLLKSGGKIYILDPTADWRLLKFADKLIKLMEPEHVKLYSTKEFQSLFASSGLKYVDTKVFKKHQKVHIAKKVAV